MNRVLSWNGVALLFAVVLVVWGTNTLTARTDRLASTQRDLVTAQHRIDGLVARLDAQQKTLDAQQAAGAVSRVISADQRCTTTGRIVQALDAPPVPKGIGAGFRDDYAKCKAQRDRYLSELTPAQVAEYEQRRKEDQ